MRAYPTSLSTTPALTDETTLESVIDGLDETLPIEMEGRYTVRELFEILVRAASRTDSIEHTAKTLEGTLSGNGIRYHLDKFDDMANSSISPQGTSENSKFNAEIIDPPSNCRSNPGSGNPVQQVLQRGDILVNRSNPGYAGGGTWYQEQYLGCWIHESQMRFK